MKRNLRRKATLSDPSRTEPLSEASTKRKRKTKTKADSEVDDYLTSPYFQNSDAPPHEQTGERLNRGFYEQDTVGLAKSLIGKVLCRKLPETGQVLRGTIVETEAYPGVGEAASHSFKGVPTQSSMAMFMDPGTAYVYMTYGMYYCFNVSSKDNGGACLFRGAEVFEDYEIMHTFRQSKKKIASGKPAKRLKQHELANGPSKLCLSFNIDRNSCDKIDMTESDHLWLEESSDPQYRLRQFVVKESRPRMRFVENLILFIEQSTPKRNGIKS